MKRQPHLFGVGHLRSGYTLVEMLVSVGILAVLMLAMHSVILIAAKAVPSPSSPPAAANLAGRAMDQIAADLMYATSFTQISANQVEFVVPDRNNDGATETIRYSWSGTTGGPLVRSYNGGSTTLLEHAQNFQLAYDKRAVAAPPTMSESSEQVLIAHVISGPMLADQRINSTSWAGQYFKPTLPAGTASWRITRVSFKARIHGTNLGATKIQIRTTSGGLPTSTVLDEAILSELGLGVTYGLQTLNFTRLSGLTPGISLCLAMQWQSDADSCDIQYQMASTTSPNTYMVMTTNGGSTWAPQTLFDIPFIVYGTMSTTGPTTYRYFLTNVRCSLQAGAVDQSRITTSVRVLNEPEVAGP
jgi:prepilin-type N-terminal cleavage/methylation domain-containing protein